ncbi:hypothetical protein DFA_02889 [Cavenderia fasciculata]|uniref:Uncharacterized protein n=1 Tax=Cavenderia fasciculata TaxID=261658 RepID=F4PIR6_CACFS|nr:uncharacterized protein DFA_02889 [Cavenderia fasciculata]EGG24645.1 hypothetical protein DFA_02889 [Cavenderia fasciculata]|eukprot:XP_004362496.1 hypothetical protein DFA_02889 [Cavenderia fasciculata]
MYSTNTMVRLEVGLNLRLAIAYLKNWGAFVGYDFTNLETDIRNYVRQDTINVNQTDMGVNQNDIIPNIDQNWFLVVCMINRLVLLSEESLDYNVIIPWTDQEIEKQGTTERPASRINTIKTREALIGYCLKRGHEQELALAQAIVGLIREGHQTGYTFDPRAFTILVDIFRSYYESLESASLSQEMLKQDPDHQRLYDDFIVHGHSLTFIINIHTLYPEVIGLLSRHTTNHIMGYSVDDGVMGNFHSSLLELVSYHNPNFNVRLSQVCDTLKELATLRNEIQYRGGEEKEDDYDDDQDDDDDDDNQQDYSDDPYDDDDDDYMQKEEITQLNEFLKSRLQR